MPCFNSVQSKRKLPKYFINLFALPNGKKPIIDNAATTTENKNSFLGTPAVNGTMTMVRENKNTMTGTNIGT